MRGDGLDRARALLDERRAALVADLLAAADRLLRAAAELDETLDDDDDGELARMRARLDEYRVR